MRPRLLASVFLVTLFLFASSSSAQSNGSFNITPIMQVSDDNKAMAGYLEDLYMPERAFNSTITLTFGSYSQDIPISVSLFPVGSSSVSDGKACPVDDSALIVARGYSQGHLTSLPSDIYSLFICKWTQEMPSDFKSYCDFDGDGCAEYEDRTFVQYDVSALFNFRNVSSSVPLASTAIEIPDIVLEEMRSSSGTENLSVSLEGDVIFIYQIEDHEGVADCSSTVYRNYTASVPVSVNASFPVYGMEKLFFLKSPVLREQWFRNNRFDVIVLSGVPLSHATLYLNGNVSKDLRLRTFNVIQNSYNLSEVVSIPSIQSQADRWSEHILAGSVLPVALEEKNDSFSYIYESRNPYSGIGKNNLSLEINDSCLGHAVYKETLWSRMLSYNNVSAEDGSPINSTFTRASVPYKVDSLKTFGIGAGLIAVAGLLAFINSWLKS